MALRPKLFNSFQDTNPLKIGHKYWVSIQVSRQNHLWGELGTEVLQKLFELELRSGDYLQLRIKTDLTSRHRMAMQKQTARKLWSQTVSVSCVMMMKIFKHSWICMFFPQISSRSFYIGARGWAQGEPPPLRPTSGARTVAQKMGWTGTMRTRPWTGTPRACGAQILSRAFRRPLPSTLPVAGGRSSCQTRGRCTVSTAGSSQSGRREQLHVG